jgi:hypothetical protein
MIDGDKRKQIEVILNVELPQALSIIDMNINKLEVSVQKIHQDVCLILNLKGTALFLTSRRWILCLSYAFSLIADD